MAIDWTQVRVEAEQALSALPELAVDFDLLRDFSEALAAGRLGPQVNYFASDPDPVGADDVDLVSRFSARDCARFERIGRAALESGAVAVCVLNGGMATRFGGQVKGIVELVGGRSFLELKLSQARAAGPLPFLAMNSFATHAATLDYLEERGLRGEVRSFLQHASLRLTRAGDVFRDASGAVSLYAPGHGDLLEAIRESGALAELEAAGVRAIMISNVDNVGAEPDPLIFGYHLDHGRPLTCELAEALPSDVGGTPARADGTLQVVEGFRFSSQFDFSRLHFLATNTYVISLEALRAAHALTWFYVEKQVDGRPAVQMERLVNELSRLVPTAYLATARDIRCGRFFPIKSPADLEAFRANPALVERFTSL
jgi:UTP--glucose-1-phosphate uridylyltransferase